MMLDAILMINFVIILGLQILQIYRFTTVKKYFYGNVKQTLSFLLIFVISILLLIKYT